VSQQTGFCDQSYFGTVFRSLAKMTPLTYRQRFGTGLQPSAVSLYLTQHSTTFPPSFQCKTFAHFIAPGPPGVMPLHRRIGLRAKRFLNDGKN